MASPTIKTCKLIDPKEEYLVDLDASIQETMLTLGSLNQIKQIILDNPNIISNIFCSSLSQFTLEPTFPYLEFVHWVGHNYVPSTKKIISFNGSRIIFSINLETLRKALCLPPVSSDVVQFIEEKILAIIKTLSPNQLYTFMSKMFKPEISPSNYSFPYDVSLFMETLLVVFSLLSQILGLEGDKTIT